MSYQNLSTAQFVGQWQILAAPLYLIVKLIQRRTYTYYMSILLQLK